MEPLPPPSDRLAKVLGFLSLACLLLPVVALLLAQLFGSAPPENTYVTMFVLLFGLGLFSLPLGAWAIARDLRVYARARRNGQRTRLTGLLMGAISLLLCLIAIPSLLYLSAMGDRAHAKDRAAIENLSSGMAGLVEAYRDAQAAGLPPEARIARMEDWLASQQDWKNPWSPETLAYPGPLHFEERNLSDAMDQARQEATVLGEVVFVISGARGPGRGLAGAVLTKGLDQPRDPEVSAFPVAGGFVIVRSATLPD